jgi:hypothetical protein
MRSRSALAPGVGLIALVSAFACSPKAGNTEEDWRAVPTAMPTAQGGAPPASGGSTGRSSLPPDPGDQGQLPIDVPPTPVDSGVDETCGAVQVPADVQTTETVVDIPGNVLFVFDQSRSMDFDWNDSTKLEVAFESINKAFEPVKDKLSAGVVFFPRVEPDPCEKAANRFLCELTNPPNNCVNVDPVTVPPQIPIQLGSGFLTAWKAHWPAPLTAQGSSTPTEKGMLAGEAALANPPPGNTVMVLVTDGAPTCGKNEEAPAQRLLQKGIKTFVIGLPGSGDGTDVLDRVAIAGGTAPAGCTSNCFVTPTDLASLQKVFSNIATQVVTSEKKVTIKDCTFQLTPPANANESDVHLVVTDTATQTQYEVPQANGWGLSGDYKTATLTGAICDGAKSGAYSNFSFQYGCVKVPPLPIR